MRVTLSKTTEAAARELMQALRAQNPAADGNMSQLLGVLVGEALRGASEKQLRLFAHQMISPRAKQKALLEEMKAVTKNADAETIRNLESIIKKMKPAPSNPKASSPDEGSTS